MRHFLEEPVLLLKACIGNRCLGWDLLPPASERFEFEGSILNFPAINASKSSAKRFMSPDWRIDLVCGQEHVTTHES